VKALPMNASRYFFRVKELIDRRGGPVPTSFGLV
jgi:hypothetical protein